VGISRWPRPGGSLRVRLTHNTPGGPHFFLMASCLSGGRDGQEPTQEAQEQSPRGGPRGTGVRAAAALEVCVCRPPPWCCVVDSPVAAAAVVSLFLSGVLLCCCLNEQLCRLCSSSGAGSPRAPMCSNESCSAGGGVCCFAGSQLASPAPRPRFASSNMTADWVKSATAAKNKKKVQARNPKNTWTRCCSALGAREYEDL